MQVSQNNSKHVELYTAKIEMSATRNDLQGILKKWEKEAKTNNTVAQKSKKLPQVKKALAEASHSTISGLRKTLQEGKNDIYVAYDKTMKVQAIAAKQFARNPNDGKKGVELSEIATNPANVILFGTEKPVRGAGTSVIKHIVQEMKVKKHKGSLHLVAENSAVLFYKKLGFSCEPSIGSSIFHTCELAKKKRKAFLSTYKLAGTIVLKEPAKLH